MREIRLVFLKIWIKGNLEFFIELRFHATTTDKFQSAKANDPPKSMAMTPPKSIVAKTQWAYVLPAMTLLEALGGVPLFDAFSAAANSSFISLWHPGHKQ